MNVRLATLVSHDVRLQYRYGVYYAYAFVVAFYALILFYAGAWLPAWAIGVVIYTDPAVVGFFFLGALMMLEKAEGARTALAITPVAAHDYFWSKALTLTLIALVAVTVIGSLVHDSLNWPLLVAATVLTSVQYIAIGVPIARRFRTVSSYLIGSAGLMVPVVLPGMLALYDPIPKWAIFIPAASQLKLVLISLGTGGASTPEVVAMLAITAIAAAACVWWAVRDLGTELGRK